MADDFKDFAEYILTNYKGKKVVEVGVGPEVRVFRRLMSEGMDVIATDLTPRQGIIVDDITKPREELYKGACLIYSIRPPPEVYPHLENLAKRVGSDLIIKPLSTDLVRSGKLINYRSANFYLFKKGCTR